MFALKVIHSQNLGILPLSVVWYALISYVNSLYYTEYTVYNIVGEMATISDRNLTSYADTRGLATIV